MSLPQPADQDFVMFGATGDLAKRKLLPALYSLCASNAFCDQGQIIGLARSENNDAKFRKMAREAVEKSVEDFDPAAWKRFEERLSFVRLDDDGYRDLARRLETPQRLVYLAVPPDTVTGIVDKLGEHNLVDGTRLIIEKPFGTDLDSALEQRRRIHCFFTEEQIFRIDHYLGKETVQNLLVFRFGNAVFERVWNRDAIQAIQITVAEDLGIEGRGSFYESVGALKDVMQSHVLQMLALITMEAPASMNAEGIRDEKAKLLASLNPVQPFEVIRGQYTRGSIGGKPVPAYRDEEGVDPNSEVETYVALRLEIDNWRWAGVPMYLRTGKRMPRRTTEVQVVFRDVPVRAFASVRNSRLLPNQLTLRIQPDEGITFSFQAKRPGPEMEVMEVGMDFSYDDSFMAKPAEAYTRLIHDAMLGDHTLFVRADEVESAWTAVQLAVAKPSPITYYAAGSWGPAEADELLPEGHWRLR